ncbi:isoaspartyl peptidase/L-asparaginase [Staphylothermus hellenicus]|nr:isoaspartyl peptidase/L-asparaginase [Staphylothermus hellenicus]
MAKSIILHGGAGSWKDSKIREKAYVVMEKCTRRAWEILNNTNNALEAVVEAVKCMEDSGYLNAGVGSVLDILGNRTLDAGIMTSNGLIGAVSAVKATRNPIVLARIVAEKTPHIIIGGDGADTLARLYGLPPLPPPPKHAVEGYYENLKKLLGGEISRDYWRKILAFIETNENYKKFVGSLANTSDTVGAVAVDDNGLLAAAVSTGGVILKLPGRIGDSPIPGAGFYSSKKVACSSTGFGEMIIRSMPCLKLAEYMDQGMNFEEALDKVITIVNETVGKDTMGFIAVDYMGRIGWRYNTKGMLIGYIDREGRVIVNHKP